ncbi:MAG: N-acetyltransferase [Pseudolysinimonas sp.]
MPFAQLPSEIPSGLATADFLLRPLLTTDVELDYAAVMESKIELRPWEQTGWPADDFTVADDLVDLVDLEERHRDRRSLTYTVMNLDETECLGCVYLMPPDATSFTHSEIAPLGDDRWSDVGAAVYFWVRTSRLASGLDGRLLDALRGWIARDWQLGRHVFVTNEQCAQQVELIRDAGLELRFRIQGPGQAGAFLAYEDGANS